MACLRQMDVKTQFIANAPYRFDRSFFTFRLHHFEFFAQARHQFFESVFADQIVGVAAAPPVGQYSSGADTTDSLRHWAAGYSEHP